MLTLAPGRDVVQLAHHQLGWHAVDFSYLVVVLAHVCVSAVTESDSVLDLLPAFVTDQNVSLLLALLGLDDQLKSDRLHPLPAPAPALVRRTARCRTRPWLLLRRRRLMRRRPLVGSKSDPSLCAVRVRDAPRHRARRCAGACRRIA